MESTKLQNLAAKFWQGICSEEEENQLREAIRFGKVPAGLEDLEAYFQGLESVRTEETLGDDFDQAILASISKPQKTKTKVRPMFLMRIAATAALFIALGFGANSLGLFAPAEASSPVHVSDTYQDPGKAFSQVKLALYKMSTNLNKGLQPAFKLSEFHKNTKRLNK
ncbi:MAG: hypothetical protein AB8F95_17895 [Bacteroidia bacterium]